MASERRYTFAARLENVEAACDFVAEVAGAASVDDDGIYHCRLSIEEICTNVIEHGYGFDHPSAEIEIVCRTFSDRLEVTVIDDAPPFDPLSLPPPDPKMPLWERQGGGWGVYFVKKFMNSVSYANVHGRNHLTMVKALPR
jgi:serine/threonine-protein kinase RsbW